VCGADKRRGLIVIVVCNRLDEFFDEVKCQRTRNGTGCLFQKTIRFSRTSQPQADCNGNRRREGAKWEVFVHVSGLIIAGQDEGEYLLEYSEDCGIDYHDATQEMAGTAVADGVEKRIREFAVEYGFEVGPGVLGV